MESLLRHMRYSTRALSRTPGFTVTVVLTLALGIGANSAVFSAIDAVLLKPLPFPDGDRLMRGTQLQGSAETPIAPIRLEDWNRLGSAFEAITGYYTSDLSETSGDLPERLRVAMLAPRFLEVLGIVPTLGRGFGAVEQHRGAVFAQGIARRRSRLRGRACFVVCVHAFAVRDAVRRLAVGSADVVRRSCHRCGRRRARRVDSSHPRIADRSDAGAARGVIT